MIRYNVDEVLNENRPVIVFRGVDYAVRDVSVKETIRNIRDAKKKEDNLRKKQRERIRKEAEAEGFSGDDLEPEVTDRISALSLEDEFADYLPAAIEALQKSLVDFPTEVAESITMKEFRTLQRALQAANNQEYSVVGIVQEGGSKKK